MPTTKPRSNHKSRGITLADAEDRRRPPEVSHGTVAGLVILAALVGVPWLVVSLVPDIDAYKGVLFGLLVLDVAAMGWAAVQMGLKGYKTAYAIVEGAGMLGGWILLSLLHLTKG